MIAHRFLHWMRTASTAQRAEATHALARSYLFCDLDEDTLAGMEAAMTIVLDDPSPEVRYALADGLAAGLEAPRHIILALAAEKAGSTDRAAIAGAIRDVANAPGEVILPGEWAKAKELIAAGTDINYEGAAGSQDFDANGDVPGVYVTTVIDDGKIMNTGMAK